MAMRSTAASAYLVSGSGLPSPGLMSITGWGNISTDTNARARIFTIAGSGGQTISVVLSSADGTTIGIRTGAVQVDGTNLTVGTPFHFGFTSNGDVRSLYLNGSLDAQHTVANSFTPVGLYLFSATIDGFNGWLEGIKIWDAVLTEAEIQAEMDSMTPVRTADLNRWTPLAPYGVGIRNQDRSGNGRHWTENGTLTDEAGSGVAWASPIVVAAGSGTGQGLSGSSLAQAAMTPAAGQGAGQVLDARTVISASMVPAAGVATAAALNSASTVAASMLPALGEAAASVMQAGAVVAVDLVPAAGAATAAILDAGSTAAASLVPAAGQGAGEVLQVGGATGASMVPASGMATAAVLEARATVAASLIPATGTSAAAVLTAQSIAASNLVPAVGTGQGLPLFGSDASAPPAPTFTRGKRMLVSPGVLINA